MTENMPMSETPESELNTELAPSTPTFLQQNKLVLFIVSAVLVVTLGAGAFFIFRPSPAQPYIDKICAAFDGLALDKQSYNENKVLLDAQKLNLEVANELDSKASIEISAGLREFGSYIELVNLRNLRTVVAMQLNDLSALEEVIKQIDEDAEVGKAALGTVDTACGR